MKGVKGEIDQRPKRFYREVDVAPTDAGFAVRLDGRIIKTPAKLSLLLPAEPLAQVIAEEWRRQEERIDLQSMFGTRMANVALDRTPETRAELAEEAVRFAQTDLVNHLADEPEDLVRRQESAWSPLRDWAAEALGARLIPVRGIIAAEQPAQSLDAIRSHALSLDDFRLTSLVYGISLLGSAVLGLAVERRRLTAVDAYETSRVDEAFQAAVWGQDAEAVRFAERGRQEAAALDLWFDALGAPV